jgi:putative acetyltransferase
VFEPARRLHQAFGFEYCPRFGEYLEDPDSVFMTRRPG